MVCYCLTSAAAAQQSAAAPATPEPSAQTEGLANGQLANGQAAGVIFGSVSDSDGDLVPGARVTLISSGETGERTVVTDSGGRFQFSGVAAGAFEITATAKGLASAKITGTLKPGALFDAPPIKLSVESTSTVVTVTPKTQFQIAEEEVRTEEKQRVLGIVPNYFVTYDLHPVPLTAKQKYRMGLRVVIDPTHFIFSAIAAGVEQESNAFPGYGSGPQGYGKRYGADLATSTTSSLLRDSVYPSLFHQDPRYFYKGTGTVWQRTKYALATAVICKGDNGQWEPNYSGILGNLSAGALANVYYAPSDRHGAALTFENGLLSIAGEGFGHLLQEFVFRRFTKHAPQPGTPQP
jgi:Carboxypeptidase regulatory-like domain